MVQHVRRRTCEVIIKMSRHRTFTAMLGVAPARIDLTDGRGAAVKVVARVTHVRRVRTLTQA